MEPLIEIWGPNFSQALLMIFNSRAIVDSCAGVAWLTSIVNFFMFLSYLLIVFVSWRLQLGACGLQLFSFIIFSGQVIFSALNILYDYLTQDPVSGCILFDSTLAGHRDPGSSLFS